MKLGGRLPADFIAARKQERVVHAFAELVLEKGWQRAKISDIVRRAGVARKTLYDNFEGKEAIAAALVAKAFPALDQDKLEGCLWLLVVEHAARREAGSPGTAAEEIEEQRGVLSRAAASIEPEALPSDDPLLCTLPPGRHGLPREFVPENQQTRLLAGMAWAIVDRGYDKATIADITRAAAVSRRTFYEHFADKEAAAAALVVAAAEKLPWPKAAPGWKGLLVELVAVGMTSQVGAARKVKEVDPVLRILAEQAAGLKAAAA
jgi:AcrR family transcriptional regulator